MPNATQTALVYIPVWIATGCWFLGVGCWLLDYRTALRWSWAVGAIILLVHIAASYAIVYQWDHAAAVEATRAQSRRVVGIDAGWGVYVNFLFAIVWLAFSLRLFSGNRPRPLLEKCVVGFTGGIMFFAAVVFASQIVAWTSGVLFLMIGVLALWTWWHPNGIRE